MILIAGSAAFRHPYAQLLLGGVLLEGWQICRRYSVPVSVKGGISVQKKKGMNVKGKQLLRKPAFSVT